MPKLKFIYFFNIYSIKLAKQFVQIMANINICKLNFKNTYSIVLYRSMQILNNQKKNTKHNLFYIHKVPFEANMIGHYIL